MQNLALRLTFAVLLLLGATASNAQHFFTTGPGNPIYLNTTSGLVPVTRVVTELSETLSPNDIQTLDAEIQEVRSYTATTVLVVLFEGLNEVDGQSYADVLLSCYSFDNSQGVAMVYSRKDNQLYVAVTARLASTITDKVKRQLLDGTAGTHLYNHQVGPALLAAVKSLGGIIAVAEGQPAQRVKPVEPPSLVLPVVFSILGALASATVTMYIVRRVRRKKARRPRSDGLIA